MKQYKRIMLGPGSKYAQECYEGNFIGADYDIHLDLSKQLPEQWRDFNDKFIPIWLEAHPGKSKVAAGLACGMLWTVCKGIRKQEMVLCPDGEGNYLVGEVDSDYYYVPDHFLPHRRKVKWYPVRIERAAMSQELQRSSGSIGTVSDISKYAEEIETLIGGKKPPKIISTDTTIEDPSVFALEKHLEDFLVQNWKQTVLGKKYEIYEDEGELVGQQYPSDTGPIDILALRKDGREILVVELKKGRASDVVIGQVQRYMGYVLEELAEPDQEVRGVIIALEDDLRLRRALRVTTNIDFFRYEIKFKLVKD